MTELISVVKAFVEKIKFVSRVEVVGSYKDRRADEYSNVDLLVDVKEKTADKALLAVTAILKEDFKPLWSDFAKSLAPEKFLVSMYFETENSFRYFDIGISNRDMISYDPGEFKNDKYTHLMKLW